MDKVQRGREDIVLDDSVPLLHDLGPREVELREADGRGGGGEGQEGEGEDGGRRGGG